MSPWKTINSPHMAPSFCCGRRITRRGGAYSLKYGRRMRRPYNAFSVFPSCPATAALQRPREERRRHAPGGRHIRASLLASLLLTACGANEVVVQGQFPAPLLEKVPVTLGVYYSEEFRGHEFFDQAAARGESDWMVRTGDAQVRMYDALLGGMFERVVHLDELPWDEPGEAAAETAAETAGEAGAKTSTETGKQSPQMADQEMLAEQPRKRPARKIPVSPGGVGRLDAILVPHVDELQYAIPLHTKVKVFEVWMRYRYELYSPVGEILADWTMTCYGKTPTAFMQGAEAAVNLAAVVALRDAGANFAMSFAQVAEVGQWLEQFQTGAGETPRPGLSPTAAPRLPAEQGETP